MFRPLPQPKVMSDVDDEEEYERRLATLFAACDAHQDGAVDQEEPET